MTRLSSTETGEAKANRRAVAVTKKKAEISILILEERVPESDGTRGQRACDIGTNSLAERRNRSLMRRRKESFNEPL